MQEYDPVPRLHQYRLFISHAWRYSQSYYRIENLLDAAYYFRYRNYSSHRGRAFEKMPDKELKEQLRRQIRPVEVCIILGGMYVNHSHWIQFEINVANRLGKPILGVFPRGALRMP